MKNKMLIFLAVLAGVTFTTTVAMAEQAGAGHYMPGTFSDFSTTVPTQPGWTFANWFVNYNDGTVDERKEMPLGHVLALNMTANVSAEVPLVMYCYPVDFFGGTLGSGAGIPFVWERVKADAVYDRNHIQISGVKEQSTSGLGDIQLIPVMAGWTNGDFKFDFFMNIWAPTGDYNKDDIANTGLGYWTFTPMGGVSWLSSKFGTEASIFSGVDFNTENQDAHYQSGNIFHVDATVAQHFPLFGGFAGAGVSAFWIRQISSDSNDYPAPVKDLIGGFMVNTYGIGPNISYVHKVGKSDLIFDASWLPQTFSDNTTKGNYFWAKLTLSF